MRNPIFYYTPHNIVVRVGFINNSPGKGPGSRLRLLSVDFGEYIQAFSAEHPLYVSFWGDFSGSSEARIWDLGYEACP